MTYSTLAGRPTQFSVGLFQPSRSPAMPVPCTMKLIPRLEAEGVWSWRQHEGLGRRHWPRATRRDVVDETQDGFACVRQRRLAVRQRHVLVHWRGLLRQGRRHHAAVQRLNGGGAALTAAARCGEDLRKSLWRYGQVTITPANSKVTLAGSWGISILMPRPMKRRSRPRTSRPRTGWRPVACTSRPPSRSRWSAKSTMLVTEGTVADADKNNAIAPAFGLMLFF